MSNHQYSRHGQAGAENRHGQQPQTQNNEMSAALRCLLWQQYLLGYITRRGSATSEGQDHTKQEYRFSEHACRGRVKAVQGSLQHPAQEVILGNALFWHHVDQGPEGAVPLLLHSPVTAEP